MREAIAKLVIAKLAIELESLLLFVLLLKLLVKFCAEIVSAPLARICFELVMVAESEIVKLPRELI